MYYIFAQLDIQHDFLLSLFKVSKSLFFIIQGYFQPVFRYLKFSKYVRTLSWYVILLSQIFSFHFVPIYAIVILHSLKNCNFFMILGYSKPVFGYHKFSKYIRTLSWYVILLSQTYPYILIPINIIVTLPSLRNSYFGQFWAIFSLFSGT